MTDKTWGEINQEIINFITKKYENYKRPSSHGLSEVVEEAEDIVENSKQCLRQGSKGTKLREGYGEELEKFVLTYYRRCKTIRPDSKILKKKKNNQCTFAVDSLRDLLHRNPFALRAFVMGCPVQEISRSQAEERTKAMLDDLDLATNLVSLKEIKKRNRRNLRKKEKKEGLG